MLRPVPCGVLVPGACMLSHFSHVQLIATPWTVALNTGFSRQEHWSELPYLPPGDLPDPGIRPASLSSPVLAGRFFTTSATWEVPRPGMKPRPLAVKVESNHRMVREFPEKWYFLKALKANYPYVFYNIW